MEAILASADNAQAPQLPGNLNYSLDPQGTFITARNEVQSFALVQHASPSGVKQITINLASPNSFLDPKSVLLSFNLRNDDAANPLQPSTCGCHSLFESLVVRMSGQEVERVTDYSRICELFTKLSYSPKKRRELAQIGFGTEPVGTAYPDDNAAHVPSAIAANTMQRCFMRFDLSSVLSQPKLLPLWALGGGSGLQLILTLAPANSAVVTGAGKSSTYHLEDIRCLWDEVQLQAELQESFLSSMLQGATTRLHLRAYEVHTNYLDSGTAGSFSISVQRSYTRLAAIAVCFSQTEADTEASATNAKLCNTHYFPTASKEVAEYYVQIGGKRQPQQNVVGTKESFVRAMKAMGIGDSLAHTGSISMADYESNCHAIFVDFEKAGEGLISTGENLSAGSVLQIHFKNFGTNAATVPRVVNTVCIFERLVEIADTEVRVFE